jgi:hypothetical protein
MVVKLYFTDGSEAIRDFTDNELNKYNLMDNLLDYFSSILSSCLPIESFEFCDKNVVVDGWNFINFDYRSYFNYFQSFIGLQVDGLVVDRFEFFKEGTYEHSLGSLDGVDPYRRVVKINYILDHYYYSKNTFFDPENWE